MGLEVFGVVLGGIASFATLILSYVIYRVSSTKDQSDSDKSDATRLAVLETKVDLLWAGLQKDMAKGIRNA